MSEALSPLARIQQRIQAAAQRAGRDPAEITLVAVSKTKPLEAIQQAYAAGVRHFGENRSEEFAQKVAALADLTDIQWHFIGHLQTRQSLPVANHAHYFHAIDRLKIAERLNRQLDEQQRHLPVFMEINVSGEASKGGFSAANWEQDAAQRQALVDAVQTLQNLPQLQLQGLMTMAPFDADEAEIRSVFRRLRELSEYLHQQLTTLDAKALSMGMSGDFEIAIEEGATHVRVGSAIFGSRH